MGNFLILFLFLLPAFVLGNKSFTSKEKEERPTTHYLRTRKDDSKEAASAMASININQARDPPEWEEEEEGGGIIIDLSRRTLYSAAQLKKELDTREKVKNKEIDPKNPVDSSRGADKNWQAAVVHNSDLISRGNAIHGNTLTNAEFNDAANAIGLGMAGVGPISSDTRDFYEDDDEVKKHSSMETIKKMTKNQPKSS